MQKEEMFWDWVSRFHGDVAKGKIQGKIIEVTKKYLGPDDIVLDYACATGLYSVELAKVAKAVDGIDISEKMIQIARSNALPNTRFRKATIFDIERSEHFDMVLAFNVLHFIKEEEQLMDKIETLLKSRAIFISVTPCLGDKGSILGIVAIIFRKLNFLPFLKRYKSQEMSSLIASRLEIIESIELTRQLRMIVARKSSGV